MSLINCYFAVIFALGRDFISRFEVVIDGANIVHDNKNLDPSGWAKIEPRRLEKVIKHCENLGYENIIVFLKKGTYDVAKDEKNAEKIVGNPAFFDQLIEEGKLELVASRSEDIFWLEFPLLNSAYIITKDAFRDKKTKQEDGTEKLIQRERSLFPNLDWVTIDSLLIRYHFLQGRFIAPSLPAKNKSPIVKVKDKQKSRKKPNLIITFFDRFFGFESKSSQKLKSEKKTKRSSNLNKQPNAKKDKSSSKKTKEPSPKKNVTPPQLEVSETKSSVESDGDELPIEHFIEVILKILSESEITTLDLLGQKIIKFQEANNWKPYSMTYFLNRHGLSKSLGLRRSILKLMPDFVLISGNHPTYQITITDKGIEYLKNNGK